MTASEYTSANLPWFDYYDDSEALGGSAVLSALTSVAAKSIASGNGVLPDNEPVTPKVIKIRPVPGLVRGGEF